VKNYLSNLPKYVWLQILVGLIGVVLSIVLHELFHVLMHFDQAPHIGLFPGHNGAIVEILVRLPPGYDLEGEEFAAYTITLLVLLITIVIIFWIRDAADKRSAGQILFPDDKKLQKMSPSEMLKLSGQVDDIYPATPKSRIKTKRRK
jgi:hypothetical protein